MNRLTQPTTYLAYIPILIGCALLLWPGISYANDEEVGKVFYWLLNAVAHITAIAGVLLNLAVDQLVVQMGTKVNDEGLGQVINTTWTVIRDLMNIGFIFALIYIGFLVIYDAGSNSAKKLLAPLIIAALLINFSLFFTKVLIDVSNIAAIEIYQSLPSVTNPDAERTGSGENYANYGISGAAAERMGITDIVAQGAIETDTGASIAYFFSSIIFLAIAFVVFIAGAVLLVVRFVALIFIMIFSPLLFAGMIFPKAQSVTKKWLDYALRYAFFAPAYFLMLYISFRILGGQDSPGVVRNSDTNLLEAIKGEQGVMSVLLEFTIVCGFMIGSLILAQKMGIAGSGTVISVANKLRGTAQGFAGRRTVGSFSNWAQKKYDKMDAGGASGKFTAGALRVIAGGERNLRGTLEAGKKSKFGGSYSYEDEAQYDSDWTKRRDGIQNRTELSQAIKDGADSAPGSDAKITMEQKIRDASSADLLEMAKNENDRANLSAVADALNESQFKALMESSDLTKEQKGQIAGARADKIIQALSTTGTNDLADLGKANKDQLKSIDFDKLNENAIALQASQMDDLKSILSNTQYALLKDRRKTDLVDLTRGSVDNAKTILNKRLTEKDIAMLPEDVLTHQNFMDALVDLDKMSTSLLAKIATVSDIDGAGKKRIRTNLSIASGGVLPTNYNTWFGSPVGQQFVW